MRQNTQENGSAPSNRQFSIAFFGAISTRFLDSLQALLQAQDLNFFRIDDVENPDALLAITPPPALIIFVVQDSSPPTMSGKIIPACQIFNYSLPETIIFMISKDRLNRDFVATLSRFNITKFFTNDEITSTSKLSWFLNYALKSPYLPIKSYEVDWAEPLPTDLYYFMPLNKKFLRIAKAGRPLQSSQTKSISTVTEFYIIREDLRAFTEYCRTHHMKGKSAITRNARIFLNNFSNEYGKLVNSLDSDVSNLKRGKDLMSELEKLADELRTALQFLSFQGLNEVVSNCMAINLSPLERTPAILSYVVYFSRNFVEPSFDIKSAILSAMIYPLGFMLLPTDSNLLLIRQSTNTKDSSVNSILSQVHSLSVEMLHANRIPVDPNVKEIVSSLFPYASKLETPFSEMRPEVQLVRFAVEIDHLSSSDISRSRQSLESAAKTLCQEGFGADGKLADKFVEKIVDLLPNPNTNL